MSLIAAVLSQTNKILGILINFTGTFPTSTINTIDTNTKPAAQATNTQTGLSNQGFTGTVAGRIDTAISTRAKASGTRSKVTVSNGPSSSPPSITMLNVSGAGFLYSMDFRLSGIHGAATVTITIDSSTVSSFNIGLEGSNLASSNVLILRPDGFWYNSGSTTQPVAGNDFHCLNWAFANSLTITIQGTSSNGYQSATIISNCLYAN